MNYIREIRIDWTRIPHNSYLRDIPAIEDLDELHFERPVTIFAGENGSGKSTLLEAIAIAAGFNPEGGSKNYSFSSHDTHSELYKHLKVVRGAVREQWGFFLRAESFYNMATAEEEYANMDPRSQSLGLHRRSHGESFVALMESKFSKRGLYFMDEPEAALSPARQLVLLRAVMDSVENGSQFFIVTHSPILLAVPDAQLISFDGKVHECTYEETDSYMITKAFVNDPTAFLKEYLSESDTHD